MNERQARHEIAAIAKSLFDRGLTHGSTGNISVKLSDGWLVTPTGSSMGRLEPEQISKLDREGNLISGDPPSKEAPLHLAIYQQRASSNAIVHLHSTCSVALSLLKGLDEEDLIPPLTAYYAMRVGKLPLVPYFAPGDKALAEAVKRFSGKHHAMLLAHHGPIVAGSSLSAAVDATEELEATAKLFLSVYHHQYRTLSADQLADLRDKFPIRA
ncbi:3-oxo-tetronate 4-phosphate decarboxylase [Billgrantia sp. LNSP4103-1]|uniref:3-oxo-tetronate 4-phosphate decarboxylase n=1 Tax=Billgrantia sp. LNSP4103-1 TaxID=3410266 RepID=UPI00403F328F